MVQTKFDPIYNLEILAILNNKQSLNLEKFWFLINP